MCLVSLPTTTNRNSTTTTDLISSHPFTPSYSLLLLSLSLSPSLNPHLSTLLHSLPTSILLPSSSCVFLILSFHPITRNNTPTLPTCSHPTVCTLYSTLLSPSRLGWKSMVSRCLYCPSSPQSSQSLVYSLHRWEKKKKLPLPVGPRIGIPSIHRTAIALKDAHIVPICTINYFIFINHSTIHRTYTHTLHTYSLKGSVLCILVSGSVPLKVCMSSISSHTIYTLPIRTTRQDYQQELDVVCSYFLYYFY